MINYVEKFAEEKPNVEKDVNGKEVIIKIMAKEGDEKLTAEKIGQIVAVAQVIYGKDCFNKGGKANHLATEIVQITQAAYNIEISTDSDSVEVTLEELEREPLNITEIKIETKIEAVIENETELICELKKVVDKETCGLRLIANVGTTLNNFFAKYKIPLAYAMSSIDGGCMTFDINKIDLDEKK